MSRQPPTSTIVPNTTVFRSNYTLTYTGANLTITPRAIAVTADAQTKVYGAADPALTFTYTGVLQGSDAFTGTVRVSAAVTQGTYMIGHTTLALMSNYTLSYT